VLVAHAHGANCRRSCCGFGFGEVCGATTALGGYNNPSVKQVILPELVIWHKLIFSKQKPQRVILAFLKTNMGRFWKLKGFISKGNRMESTAKS
jgi:hypothetical protein